MVDCRGIHQQRAPRNPRRQNVCVKAKPTDVDERHLLSVFLCFSGDLDRAFLQLEMIGKQDPDLGMAAQVYRSLIIAETQRRKVFHDDAKPLLPSLTGFGRGTPAGQPSFERLPVSDVHPRLRFFRYPVGKLALDLLAVAKIGLMLARAAKSCVIRSAAGSKGSGAASSTKWRPGFFSVISTFLVAE